MEGAEGERPCRRNEGKPEEYEKARYWPAPTLRQGVYFDDGWDRDQNFRVIDRFTIQ
jgi:hypothetical protein